MHRTRQRHTAYILFLVAAIALTTLVLWLALPVVTVKRLRCPKGRVPVFYVARGTIECQLLDDENLSL